MSGGAEPRLLAHAAPMVSGTDTRHLRPPAWHSRRRDAASELHSSGRISLHHSQRVCVRLGRLSEDARSCETAHWLGRLEKETAAGTPGRPTHGNRHWYNA